MNLLEWIHEERRKFSEETSSPSFISSFFLLMSLLLLRRSPSPSQEFSLSRAKPYYRRAGKRNEAKILNYVCTCDAFLLDRFLFRFVRATFLDSLCFELIRSFFDEFSFSFECENDSEVNCMKSFERWKAAENSLMFLKPHLQSQDSFLNGAAPLCNFALQRAFEGKRAATFLETKERAKERQTKGKFNSHLASFHISSPSAPQQHSANWNLRAETKEIILFWLRKLSIIWALEMVLECEAKNEPRRDRFAT